MFVLPVSHLNFCGVHISLISILILALFSVAGSCRFPAAIRGHVRLIRVSELPTVYDCVHVPYSGLLSYPECITSCLE